MVHVVVVVLCGILWCTVVWCGVLVVLWRCTVVQWLVHWYCGVLWCAVVCSGLLSGAQWHGMLGYGWYRVWV